MQGIPLVIVFVIAVIVMILMISKYNIHPFLSILTVSLVLGLIGGIPLVNQTAADGSVTPGIASVIGSGFSNTFNSIGIVIIFGALIGTLLEVTGGALKISDMVIRVVGKKHPDMAMLIMGWIVSIPVFCDSGFVILNPIRRALVKRTGMSSVRMTMCLSLGLYASHVFIPPTPGPIAAANTLGIGNELLIIMGMGVLVSIPALIASYFFAKFIGNRVTAGDEADTEEVTQTYEELVESYGQLPGGFMSLAPIVIPVILMALSNIASATGWTGFIGEFVRFLGTPIIALAVGAIFGIILLVQTGKSKDFYEITNNTLKTVGPILFITAAGGVLGAVIANTGLVTFIADNATVFQSIGIFFPFIISAILKTSQGSSTVALTTTAGIMAPLLPALGFTTTPQIALVVIAIGAGAMTVSHANDSYFWVVTNFGAMKPAQGYKTQTVGTLIEGLASMVGVFILSLFIM